MIFKKFAQFIFEKKGDSKDIEDAQPPKPALDPSVPLKCPKCGQTTSPCECYTDDYYNAKLGQQTPRPNKIVKPKKKENE
jgi:hypothetical protein